MPQPIKQSSPVARSLAAVVAVGQVGRSAAQFAASVLQEGGGAPAPAIFASVPAPIPAVVAAMSPAVAAVAPPVTAVAPTLAAAVAPQLAPKLAPLLAFAPSPASVIRTIAAAPSSPHHRNLLPLIIGLAVAGALAACCCLPLCCFLVGRRKAQRQDMVNPPAQDLERGLPDAAGVAVVRPLAPAQTAAVLRPTLADLRPR